MLPIKIFLQVEIIVPQDKPELGISAKDKLYLLISRAKHFFVNYFFDTSPEVSIKVWISRKAMHQKGSKQLL
jgi:hypothetical protein